MNKALDAFSLNSELGQVWTPPELAKVMAQKLVPFVNETSVILDPACGPGTFVDACQGLKMKYRKFECFEIDKRLTDKLSEIPPKTNVEIINQDFLKYPHKTKFYDAAILNPPYLRHEVLSSETKKLLNGELLRINENRLPARSNLYAYFITAVANLLAPKGVMVAIVYDSLRATIYGKQLVENLLQIGTFISRESIQAPFESRLIDAEIFVWQKNENDEITPLTLKFEISESKSETFCPVQDFVSIKRGSTFPTRNFFVNRESPHAVGYRALITKQRLESGTIAKSNVFGLFHSGDTKIDEENLRMARIHLSQNAKPEVNSLPKPVLGEILFNYYFRNHPRHLFNPNLIPASDNFYVLNSRESTDIEVFWFVSNSSQFNSQLMRSSRSQGSGLYKLQLFEYRNCLFPNYRILDHKQLSVLKRLAVTAIQEAWPFSQVVQRSTAILSEFGFQSD